MEVRYCRTGGDVTRSAGAPESARVAGSDESGDCHRATGITRASIRYELQAAR